MDTLTIDLLPLTHEGFEPFGDVIDTAGARHFPINAGSIERFHDLARVEPGEGGRVLISIARANHAAVLPHQITLVERHPLASQAFIPLHDAPMIIVVGPAGEGISPGDLRAFVSNGRQGINYRPGVWHMPLIAPAVGLDYLIVDRGGPGGNCDEHRFTQTVLIRGGTA